MDIAIMEAASVLSLEVAGASQSAAVAQAQRAQAQVSVYDIADFETRLKAASVQPAEAAAPAATTEQSGFRGVIESLRALNGDVELLGDEALRIASGGREMTPGDMVMLTVRCHQFLFHCELTANVANRSSEGVQQLFRQQS